MIEKSNQNSQNIEALVNLFTCPVELTPLKTAVTLTPCAHKVNESVAKKLFGGIDSNSKYGEVIKEGKCPLCKEVVISYYADHTFRDVVSRFFSLSVDSNKGESIEGEILKNELYIENVEENKISYPRKSAKFIHKLGDWQIFNWGYDCRELNFASITDKSFIENFCLLGYEDKSISLSVRFCKELDPENIIDYLKSFSIEVEKNNLPLVLCLKNKDDRVKMFKILAENNELPAEYLNQIEELCGKESWED